MTGRVNSASMRYWPPITAAVLLVLAVLGRWPYGFYTLLRIVVCIAAIYTGIKTVKAGMIAWAWVMGATALLFNPLFSFHMRRSNWRILDLLAAILFASCVALFRSKTNPAATR